MHVSCLRIWGRLGVLQQRTDVRGDAREDDLAFVLSSYRRSEVRVVPCVDLSVSLDQWGSWVHRRNLFWENAVGSCLGAGSQDDRNAE